MAQSHSCKLDAMPTVLAAADIGSNTAHLLISAVSQRGIQRVDNESEWLSLGEIVSHDGQIPDELIGRLVQTLNAFKQRCIETGAEFIYVFATEAMRKATNHRQVIRFVRQKTGLDVDLISPRREAELGLKGALLDSPVSGRFVFAESGGGSVQVAVCEGPEILTETSVPIGTGVLIDQAGVSQPATPNQVKAVQKAIDKGLAKVRDDADARQIVACGGVARGLWRALHPDGNQLIQAEELRYLSWATQRLNILTISQRYSVKAKRAATLLPGSLVYLALMEKFGATEMTVSQFGVREGAILEMSQGKIGTCAL